MDISTGTQTGLDIFRLIIDEGPLTLYAASSQSTFSLGTIHRHFKEMEKSEKIISYKDEDTGRRKKPYGPTVFGFVYYSRIDERIRSKLENYFLIWLDYEDFQEDLKKNGFNVDEMIRHPKKSKDLFRKYVEYGSLIEEQIDYLKNNWDSLPRDLSMFIGETVLLSRHPSNFEIWKEMYQKMPGVKNYIDSILKNMQAMQKQLQS